MFTYSIDSNIRPKVFSSIDYATGPVVYSQPISRVPSLTNDSISTISNVISSKPQLITRAELQNLGQNIKLVGYNTLDGLVDNSDKTFSCKLLNYVEPYEYKGLVKTLFYTQVNTELKVGDRVFIINGNYDSDLLIQKNKYRIGRDGYKVIYIDKCKVALDIDYTGQQVFETGIDTQFIQVYYVKNSDDFKYVNRMTTTRDGSFKNRFSYFQNHIAYIDKDYPYASISYNWGKNNGVTGTPGFFVRSATGSWTNITSQILSGSFSLSVTASNTLDSLKVINGDFTFSGYNFKKDAVYKWTAGPTNSYWKVDVTHYEPYLTKNNFRNGIFKGKWNAGLYGQYYSRIKWHGDGFWSIGAMINTNWKKGVLNSIYTASQSYFSSFDQNGQPYQKINSPNNAGRGFNFISDSIFDSVNVYSGSFYSTKFGTQSATFSVVENEVLGLNTLKNLNSFNNILKNCFFDDCEFDSAYIENSELKRTKSTNSRIERTKSINSYFKKSVMNNSIYNSDDIIKIYNYSEYAASEISNYLGVTNKVYKFYIDLNGYKRLKESSSFYIKGLKINNRTSVEVINFFDKKFKIGTWTEYTEENFGITTSGKKGYEYSAFLSTPEDNSYNFTTVGSQSAVTTANSNSAYYSIDIWVSRYDITGSPTASPDTDFDLNSSTLVLQNPSVMDISTAFIQDSDFESGLFENSDWNSGYHIESNYDNNITVQTTKGRTYSLSIDSNLYLTATTSYNSNFKESSQFAVGDIVFLDSVDFKSGASVSRIPDTWKVVSVQNNVYKLSEVGTVSHLLSLSASNGYFYTEGAKNRFGHIKSLKFNRANIKSGFIRRGYFNNSLIQNLNYDISDKDLTNLERIRSLVISDGIFAGNGNILSNATYINSFFTSGSDDWNSGIVHNSVWNGPTFSGGVIRESSWVNGNFTNGTFYGSNTFNAQSDAVLRPNYYTDNISTYYREGTLPNDRYSWQKGNFIDGDFEKSDWEGGIFYGGRFYFSKWYDGYFLNGFIGDIQLAASDTKFYNGTVSQSKGSVTVENATLVASDTSFTASQASISWINGTFNNGVFGTDTTQNATNSAVWYNGQFNGGQFTDFARWKAGTFNGGKFLSSYGWTQSSSMTQSDYGWESGTFNGGEFGNANGSTNSTWYTGDFNGGIFKGRVWNNGIFLFGEFQGSATTSSVGGGTSANARYFVNGFTNSYYGLWRNGLVSNTKDRFIKDQKFYTFRERAYIVERRPTANKKALIKNSLWLAGTFSHPSGEMNNTVWLDGTFEKGKFKNSSFNPYVEKSKLGIATVKLADQILYNYDFTKDGDPFTPGTQSIGWATASSSTGGKYSTFSAGYTASWAPGLTMAYYVGGASSSGLTLSNLFTKLSAGEYQFDLNIVTHSSSVNLKVNVGSYSYFTASSPLTLGNNSFRAQTGGGSVSIYVDTNGVGGNIAFDYLSIKPILPTFNFNDDTCYWKGGDLEQSDFYISRWKSGNFLIGTAIGAIWENGTTNYMNAFNVFWQNGTWKNGNWYGSSFEFNGQVTDDYVYNILQRGMSWSGTSSCHIWNIFLVSSTASITVGTASANNFVGGYWRSETRCDADIAAAASSGLVYVPTSGGTGVALLSSSGKGGVPS